LLKTLAVWPPGRSRLYAIVGAVDPAASGLAWPTIKTAAARDIVTLNA
jgi:hypothetical protein